MHDDSSMNAVTGTDVQAVEASHFMAIRFDDLCLLASVRAPDKQGYRQIAVTAPGGLTVTATAETKWGVFQANTGNAATDEDVQGRINHLQRFVFPETDLLCVFPAADWPEDASLAMDLTLDDDTPMVTIHLRPQQVDVLAGPVIGMQVHVIRKGPAPSATAPDTAANTAPDTAGITLVLNGKPVPLVPEERVFPGSERIVHLSARLPARIYDRNKHRFRLSSGEGALRFLPEAWVWRCPSMFNQTALADSTKQRPLLPSLPPADVQRTHAHRLSNWLSPEERNRRIAKTLEMLRSPVVSGADRVAAYIFAPNLAAALATPALLQLADWYGADMAPHLVLPSTEAAEYGLAIDPGTGIEQLIPILPGRQVLEHIRQQPPGMATIALPAGTELDADARSMIDAVLDGRTAGCAAHPALHLSFGAATIRIVEANNPVALTVTPDTAAAIYSQRYALRSLHETVHVFHQLPLPTLEIIGLLEAPFARHICSADSIDLPERPLHLVLDEYDLHSSDEIERLEQCLSDLEKAGCDATILCSHKAYNTLRKDERVRRRSFIATHAPDAGTDTGTGARTRTGTRIDDIGRLLPGDCPVLSLTGPDLLTLHGNLGADGLIQAFRATAFFTEVSSTVTLHAENDDSQAVYACETRRVLLHPNAAQ